MKANELTIGQRYIWRRNSSTEHEVTYIGFNPSNKYLEYEFEYIKEGEKRIELLSVHHVDSDVFELNSIKGKFYFLEKYYPNYYGSDEIACLNDLAAFIDNDITYECLKERQLWIDGIYPHNLEKEFKRLMSKAIDKCEIFECDNKITPKS